jgi:hypothetical protein
MFHAAPRGFLASLQRCAERVAPGAADRFLPMQGD